MASQIWRDRSLVRSARGKRLPRSEIVIVCEGKVTEPKYFASFKDVCGNELVVVKTVGGCGVPFSVVERAVYEMKTRQSAARKTRDSFDLNFEVWAVFDRDQHPREQVPRAMRLAAENRIQVAYSNPCFEIWGLMHFRPCNRPGHHHDAQRQLKDELPSYCHENNPIIDAKEIQKLYASAVQNAEDACKQRAIEGQPNGDPSTTVFKLTERIRQFGRT